MNGLSLCDFSSFSWLLLWWLLPFLLGLLLGWFLWSRYQRELQSAKEELGNRDLQISNLESELKRCKETNGKLNEKSARLESEIQSLRTQTEPTGRSKTPVAALSSQAPSSSSAFGALKSDQLQIIEGIGPKMESILKDKGIKNWGALAAQTPVSLRQLLDSFGSKYKIIDPSTWSEQAQLAHEQKWDELVQRQKQLSGGVLEVDKSTDAKVEKYLIKKGLLKKYQTDDLKAIEGIGPKIEQLLHKAGINSWKLLSEVDVNKLRGILADAGDRYKLADPETWPQQAQFAHNGQWKELEEYQDLLKGGKMP